MGAGKNVGSGGPTQHLACGEQCAVWCVNGALAASAQRACGEDRVDDGCRAICGLERRDSGRCVDADQQIIVDTLVHGLHDRLGVAAARGVLLVD